jgi:phage terminase small subunit
MGRKKKEETPEPKKTGRKKKVEEKKEEKILLGDLKPDHQNFVLEYIRTRNATKSYMSVYPKTKYEAAGVSAYHLLKSPKIKECIDNYYEGLWNDRKKEIGRIFDNLLNIANADLGSMLEQTDDGVRLKNLKEIDTSIIQSISQSRSDNKYGESKSLSIKLFDKSKAISDLTKVLGMITEKIEHSGDIKIIAAERPDKKKEESEED